jgi:Asp-tRNA(Asn)/Glu-tRNA(Gln) amidotransferase C subunit
VDEERVDALAAELTTILDYADQLGAIPDLAASGRGPALRRRADEPEPSPGLPLIALAAERVGDEVRVPTVVGEEP